MPKDYHGWVMLKRENGGERVLPHTFRLCRQDAWDVVLSGYLGLAENRAGVIKALRRRGFDVVPVRLVPVGGKR